MLKSAPFRFLDLPKELRFIIYESLDISTKQVQLLPSKRGLQIEQQITDAMENQPAIILTLQTLPVQILSTSRLIHSEALPFLSRKLAKMAETIPRIILDLDCLDPPALTSTQTLLCALLTNMNQHRILGSKSPSLHTTTHPHPHPQPSPETTQWRSQTTHLLLSQRPTPCPLSGFMGAQTRPTVRLVIEVSKTWRYSGQQGLATLLRTNLGAPSLYALNITSQLSQLYTGLVEHTRGLRYVKCGGIVFGQEEERVLREEGLVVRKACALDFAVWEDPCR